MRLALAAALVETRTLDETDEKRRRRRACQAGSVRRVPGAGVPTHNGDSASQPAATQRGQLASKVTGCTLKGLDDQPVDLREVLSRRAVALLASMRRSPRRRRLRRSSDDSTRTARGPRPNSSKGKGSARRATKRSNAEIEKCVEENEFSNKGQPTQIDIATALKTSSSRRSGSRSTKSANSAFPKAKRSRSKRSSKTPKQARKGRRRPEPAHGRKQHLFANVNKEAKALGLDSCAEGERRRDAIGGLAAWPVAPISCGRWT